MKPEAAAADASPPSGAPGGILPQPAAAALWGSIGGLLGALAGHLGVALAHRWTGDADFWFKGPHGPPFFDLTLSTSLYYGCLGGLLYRGRDRFRGTGLGFAAAFALLAAPLTVATHWFTWGEGPAEPETLAWFYLVLVCYAAANLGAIGALGGRLQKPFARRKAAGALAGAGLAYLLQLATRWLFPKWGAGVEIVGLIAPPSAVYGGALWGALIGFGAEASSSGIRRS